MARKTVITDESRATFAELAAQGSSNSKISAAMGISLHVVRKYRADHDTNVAIDRVRLTETIPQQLTALANGMVILGDAVAALRNDIADVHTTNKKLTKAMKRLQVENKDLRATRKDARAKVRELRRELWNVRGY
ncbi:GAS domain-containing protein [Sphingobium lactosutens]|uniref:Uncharacterized protein n=1 Tax=Sphingobium lactosutens DS20 TaxID=1331060 RepID=T0HGM3_9SPHN|nr:hypothetical protein [Sphingobium lactosutens]EQB11248.1 hypothetical protein RLDS_22870 [Sphingobium lactosutens DS20]